MHQSEFVFVMCARNNAMSGSISLVILYRNSNFIEISFYSQPTFNSVITTKFCTCHDSTAVMACAKFCSDLIPRDGMTAKLDIHFIWILRQISRVAWTLGLYSVGVSTDMTFHDSHSLSCWFLVLECWQIDIETMIEGRAKCMSCQHAQWANENVFSHWQWTEMYLASQFYKIGFYSLFFNQICLFVKMGGT